MVRAPFLAFFASTVSAQASNLISCGYSEITLEINEIPDVLKDYSVDAIGNCQVGDGNIFKFMNQDNMATWSYDCNFWQYETETHVIFENTIQWKKSNSTVPEIIFGNQFDTWYKTSNFSCKFEKTMSTSLCVTTKCDECQDCFWDPENNCTYTCDITKPCICGRPKAVILEPIQGDGSFDVRSGLYFDEHLERPITADDTIEETDRTFIGIELVDIQKPTMVVVVEKLWVTATKDPDDPDATVLIRKLPSGCAIVHPLMEGGKYPQPNAYDAANPEEHPHTAFEIDFMGISEGFIDVPNFSGFFIHVITKVCVTNGENCYGTCTDDELKAEFDRMNPMQMDSSRGTSMCLDEPEEEEEPEEQEEGMPTPKPKSKLPLCLDLAKNDLSNYKPNNIGKVAITPDIPPRNETLEAKIALWNKVIEMNEDKHKKYNKKQDSSFESKKNSLHRITPWGGWNKNATAIRNTTGITVENNKEYFELVQKLQQALEKEKAVKVSKRSIDDKLTYESAHPTYFEQHGGRKQLLAKSVGVETFGPWPLFLPPRDLKAGEQARIFFAPQSSSKFAAWSNSKSGHAVLVVTLLLNAALGFNALRLRRKQHAKLLA